MPSPNNSLANKDAVAATQCSRTRIKLTAGVQYTVNLDASRRYQIAHLGITSSYAASKDVVKVVCVRGPTPGAWTASADEEDDTELLSPSGVNPFAPRLGTGQLILGIASVDAGECVVSISVTEHISGGFEQ